ncbi:MAG: hypothetical protein ACXAD7_20685 [Candidatus Kariarchaeaceae archaeon]|jgi:uncharacterized protein YuzE
MMTMRHLWICLILLVGIIGFVDVAQAVPGESSLDPITITTGTTIGNLPGPGSYDSIWYSISLSGTYQLNLTGPNFTDFDMKIYDNNLQHIVNAMSDKYPDTVTLDDSWGDFFINVLPYEGSGEFSLEITKLPSYPGDSFYNPILISPGITIGDLSGPSDNLIYYNISLVGNFKFNLTGPVDTDFDMYLYNEKREIIDYAESNNLLYIYPELMTVYALNGTYVVEIIGYSGIGSFALNITEFALLPGDHHTNAIKTDQLIIRDNLPGPGMDGSLWYQFNFEGNYEFIFTGPKYYIFSFHLYDENLDRIDGDVYASYPEIVTVYGLHGIHFVNVLPYSDQGISFFTLNITQLPSEEGDTTTNPKNVEVGIVNDTLPGLGIELEIWYNITLNGNYLFSLSAETGTEFALAVYNSELYRIGYSDSIGYSEHVYRENLHGNYFIKIENQGFNGSFRLNITQIEEIRGLTYRDAIQIDIGITNGFSFSSSDSVWFRLMLDTSELKLSSEYYCTFILKGEQGTDFDIDLYDSNLDYLSDSHSVSYPDTITWVGLDDRLFIEISTNGRIGGFTLEVKRKLLTVTSSEPKSSEPSYWTQETDTGGGPDISSLSIIGILIVGVSIYVISKVLSSATKTRQFTSSSIDPELADLREAEYEDALGRMKTCPACDTPIPPVSIYCDNCGVKQR